MIGQVARGLVPLGLDLGAREVVEEGGHAFVVRRLVPLQDPQARPADDGVLGGALLVRPVGQHAGPELELAGALEPGVAGRGLGVHGHFPGRELGVADVGPPAVDEDLLPLPVGQLLEVLHEQRAVEGVGGVQAAEAVGLGPDRDVVPGAQVFDLDPAVPGRGEPGLGGAGRHQLLGRFGHFGPGLGRLVRIQPGLLEGLDVVVEHRGRAVERHGEHPAVRGGVVARDGGQVDARVEGQARLLHDFVDRLDRALGRHHRGRAHIEDLQDVGRGLGAEGRDAGVHGVGVVALVGRDHLVVGLGLVEPLADPVDPLTERTAVSVPPVDGDRRRERQRRDDQDRHQYRCHPPFPVSHESLLVGCVGREPRATGDGWISKSKRVMGRLG